MRSVIKRIVSYWLALFARVQLWKLGPRVIAVAGSSGKTSTASAVVAALRPYMRVRDGVGLNTDTGVPLGVLGIRMEAYGAKDWLRALLLAPWRVLTDWRRCDAYVAEYGIDHPGDMRRLLAIRVPDIAVLTSVGLEHAGYFPGSLEEVSARIVDEELSFLEAVGADGVAVAPVGDPAIAGRLHDLKARVARVGDDEGDDYALSGYAVTPESTSFSVSHKAVSYPVRMPFPVTRASAESMALAAAAACEAGVTLKDALRAISEAWHVPAGRGRVFAGTRRMTVIDSSYNATPFAMSDALGFARRIAGDRRVVAILGDMRELGSHAAAAHANLAHDAAAHADLVLTVGPEMRDHLVPRVRSKREARAFGDVPSLLRELDGLLKEGDVVLVKGSQNTLFLERVTERLLADRRDAELLPRRGARWDAARAVA